MTPPKKRPETVACRRCGEEAAALPAPPWPGAQGEAIAAGVCRPCFMAWQPMQTKVLNEFRLNLAEPEHAELLDRHMMLFLGLMTPEEANLPVAPEALGQSDPG